MGRAQISRTTGNGGTGSEILEINIKPGWKRGTKITFPEKGESEGEGERQKSEKRK